MLFVARLASLVVCCMKTLIILIAYGSHVMDSTCDAVGPL